MTRSWWRVSLSLELLSFPDRPLLPLVLGDWQRLLGIVLLHQHGHGSLMHSDRECWKVVCRYHISKKLPRYIFNKFISGPLTLSLSCVTGSSALLRGPWDDKEDLTVVVGTLKTAAAPKVEAAASEDWAAAMDVAPGPLLRCGCWPCCRRPWVWISDWLRFRRLVLDNLLTRWSQCSVSRLLHVPATCSSLIKKILSFCLTYTYKYIPMSSPLSVKNAFVLFTLVC